MVKGRYQVSNPENVEIYWEIDQLDVDAVFRPGVDTPFEQQRLKTWRWDVQQNNHSVRRTGGQEHSSNRNNLWETNTTPCIVENSSIWSKNKKYSWL